MTDTPKPVGPYTPIMRVGDFLLTSGQVGIAEGALVEGGLEGQLTQALANLRSVLGSEGASLDDVVKATVFLVDMDDYAAMNAIYCEAFGDHRPARSAVAVAALPLGARVEIEAIAHTGCGAVSPGPPGFWQTASMAGAVIMIVVLVVVMPVGILMSGALGAFALGNLLKRDADVRHEGSELLEVSEANPYTGPADD